MGGQGAGQQGDVPLFGSGLSALHAGSLRVCCAVQLHVPPGTHSKVLPAQLCKTAMACSVPGCLRNLCYSIWLI